ncbi:hypothetical protein THAOC_16109, partial [Thalassiosira oceanica]
SSRSDARSLSVYVSLALDSHSATSPQSKAPCGNGPPYILCKQKPAGLRGPPACAKYAPQSQAAEGQPPQPRQQRQPQQQAGSSSGAASTEIHQPKLCRWPWPKAKGIGELENGLATPLPCRRRIAGDNLIWPVLENGLAIVPPLHGAA